MHAQITGGGGSGRLALGLWLAAMSAGLAAPASEFRLDQPVDLPAEGLRFMLMPDARELAMQPPTTYTYENSATGERLDMYAPLELWRARQTLGRWRDEAGTVLTLSAMRHGPPAPSARPHVTRDEFAALVPAAAKEWTATELSAWLSPFAGLPPAFTWTRPRSPARLGAVFRTETTSGEHRMLAYAFRFRQSDEWYMASFTLAHSVPVAAAMREIESGFLGQLARSRRSGSQSETRPYRTVAGAGRDREREEGEYADSRAQVIEGIRNTPSWWFVEAPEFIIMSNMDASQRAKVSRLQTDLAALRAYFETLIPPRQPIRAVSVLRVFASPREYGDYVPPAMAWTGGIWMPAKKELVVKPIDWGREEDRHAAFLSTIYHESFHQYIFYAFDMVEPSMWYNEGHGDFFAGAELRGRDVVIRENPWRVAPLLKYIANNGVNLKELVRLSHMDFYGARDEQRERNYAMAWGLVYFLRKGVATERRSHYAALLPAYEAALWESRDEAQAMDKAFAKVDMQALQNDFTEFWRSSTRRAQAEKRRLTRP